LALVEGTDALLIKAGSVGPLRSTVEWTTRCYLSMNATRFPTLLVRYVSPRRRTHFALFHGRGTAPAAAHTAHAAPECARAQSIYCDSGLLCYCCDVRSRRYMWCPCAPRASWPANNGEEQAGGVALEPAGVAGLGRWSHTTKGCPFYVLFLQQINRSTVAVRVR
jgi:hypothetical protein